jgi:hypothetical protein
MEPQTTATKEILLYSTENLINSYQNEQVLWNVELNATEEAKDLAWRRLSDAFGMKSAGEQAHILFTQIHS